MIIVFGYIVMGDNINFYAYIVGIHRITYNYYTIGRKYLIIFHKMGSKKSYYQNIL